MKFLLLDDSHGLRELSFTRRRIIISALILIFAAAGVLTFTLDDITTAMYQAKMEKLKNKNQRVENRLGRLRLTVDSLAGKIHHIEQQDDAVRTYSGMATINSDIRDLGIGGSRYDRLHSYDFLLPKGGDRISELAVTVDSLTTRVKLEQQSYTDIDSFVDYQRALIASTPSLLPLSTGNFKRFSDGFGYRKDPFTGKRRFHYGVDLSSWRGEPVRAAADGVIEFAGWKYGYGRAVIINHGHGFATLYGHNSKLLVSRGEKVSLGDTISLVGNTGRSTGPHVHYEVLKNGKPIDPSDFFFAGPLK